MAPPQLLPGPAASCCGTAELLLQSRWSSVGVILVIAGRGIDRVRSWSVESASAVDGGIRGQMFLCSIVEEAGTPRDTYPSVGDQRRRLQWRTCGVDKLQSGINRSVLSVRRFAWPGVDTSDMCVCV